MRRLANREAWLTAAALLVCLLPWLLIQPQIRLPGDAAGLTLATLRFLVGQHMADAYFDNNPPLCFLIFLPAAWLTYASVPLWYAVPFYTLGLIALGALLMQLLLAAWPGLGPGTRRAALTAYLGAVTLPCFLEFGQKDHLIAIALPPFLLAQWSLTNAWPNGRRVRLAALVLGAPFILVKPHYGLLPVILLAHRLFRQRRWSIVLDADFLALAVGTLLYAAVVTVWFRDYVTIILPLALSLYAGLYSPFIVPAALGLGVLTSALALIAWFLPCGEGRALALLLTGMAGGALIAFAAQFKGFYLQSLPCLTLLFMGGVVTVAEGSAIGRKAFTGHGGALGIVALFALLYAIFPPLPGGRTHRDYLNGPLAAYIRANASGSSFYLENLTTHVIVPSAIYTGIPQASRFPLLWFLDALPSAPPASRAFFAAAMAQDLARDRPAFVGILRDPPPGYDIRQLFGDNVAFAREWSHYGRAGEFSLDHHDYPDHPYHPDNSVTVYDIYRRLPPTR